MRNLIYMHMVSLDGYIETDRDYGGDNWASSDPGLSQHFQALEASIAAHLYGRRIFQELASMWPMMAENPNAPASIAAYGRIWTAKPKVVFSTTLDEVGWNARLVKEHAVETVAALKAEPGQDLALYGSILAASLIPHGLVDEFRFYVNPIVLGSGKPMFPDLAKVMRLRLIETATFDCGVVLLRYQLPEVSAQMMQDKQKLLKDLYRAFNRRAIEPVLAALRPDVDWPNGWEGGRVHGHAGVRDNWTRQWAAIDPHVEPIGFTNDETGGIVVQVHQVVKDLTGKIMADELVEHIYQFEQGLIRRMDLRKP